MWQVEIPSARPLGDFEVQVDAVSGDVLRTQNVLHDFRTGKAKLFNPNPVVENGGFAGLRSDHNDRNIHLLTALRRSASLPKIRTGQNCLRGEWANAKLGHDAHSVCRRGLRWTNVKRSSDTFEALMTYYEITRAQQYIQDLGFTKGNQPIDDRSQQAVADAFRADNSFYSPFTRTIKYGSGGVDDAEDADVIWHEYGHAMQDSESHSFSTSQDPSNGALAEGSSATTGPRRCRRAHPGRPTRTTCASSTGTRRPMATSSRPWRRSPCGRFCGRRADVPMDPRQGAGPEQELPLRHPLRRPGLVECPLRTSGTRSAARRWTRSYLAAQFLYHANESFDEAAAALVHADRDRFTAARIRPRSAPRCEARPRARPSARAVPDPPKKMTRRRQGGGTPAGRLAQTGQRSPVEVVSGVSPTGGLSRPVAESIGAV